MTKRYRVFKIDNMYGVSDDIANYTLAWDTSKTIMDGLCDKLNEQDQRITELESNPAFQRVLQLIEERNLTWGAVADILDEHTILLEDVVTDGCM